MKIVLDHNESAEYIAYLQLKYEARNNKVIKKMYKEEVDKNISINKLYRELKDEINNSSNEEITKHHKLVARTIKYCVNTTNKSQRNWEYLRSRVNKKVSDRFILDEVDKQGYRVNEKGELCQKS